MNELMNEKFVLIAWSEFCLQNLSASVQSPESSGSHAFLYPVQFYTVTCERIGSLDTQLLYTRSKPVRTILNLADD